MSGGISATTIIAAVGAAASVAGAVGGLMNKPKAPQVKDPTPAPQASQAPDAGAVKKQTQAALSGGQDSTMLTGLDGVAPSSLTLGKNTLLGT